MLAGIVFTVGFVAGMLLIANTPEGDAADDEWVRWFDDSGHRAAQIIGMFLLVIAAAAFVVFIVGLIQQLRAASAFHEGANQVALAAGLIFAAAAAIGGVAMGQMSGAIAFGDLPTPAADTLRTSEQFGFGVMLVAAALFAALTMAAVSIAARGVGVLPSWLVTAGFVAAVIVLFSVMFIPIVVLPLWVLVVSIYAGRGSSTPLSATS
jgi:hypothetical protein